METGKERLSRTAVQDTTRYFSLLDFIRHFPYQTVGV